MRVCLIASSRFPIREPLAGGLEAHTFALARALLQRGHQVSLFAAEGSCHGLDVEDLPASLFRASTAARADVGARPEDWMREHHAYLDLMLMLARDTGRFDVVHNNSLHHLPLAMASMLDVPVVTTLHTPPLDWLESAIAFAPPSCRFVAVSEAMARAWSHVVTPTVVLNGVDTDQWAYGDGGGPAVWSGRLVPEKAPHLAALACRLLDRELVLAGPVMDRAYFEREVRPLLGDRIRYAGHLTHAELVRLLQAASVALVTPVWDEPYGLVAAEAMSCGTPVAAFARGGIPEIVDDTSGRLAHGHDALALAAAVGEASALDRRAVRGRAVSSFSLERMVDGYEQVYAGATRPALAS
ncbi:MAG: glycosyl transferase family 1 [Nocardioidaceae bacterium]|nr:glycosyl transferase family 1 [Nocardioidaceae bacterium]